jgi:ABC transporter related
LDNSGLTGISSDLDNKVMVVNSGHNNTVSSKSIIQIEHLFKEYKLGKQRISVIDDVNLNILEGEFVAIVGASGSGKSTLLHLLGGLDKPSQGKVIIDNQDINKLSDSRLSKFRNQVIGFIFQSFYLQPFLTLRQNIEVASMPARINKKDRRQKIDDLAKQVDLYDRLKHRPRELSGGQIQRAAIIRALLNNPKIILADEPTGNLDSKNSQDVISLFKDICSQYKTTVVIATHDQEIASQADRIFTIKDGKIS